MNAFYFYYILQDYEHCYVIISRISLYIWQEYLKIVIFFSKYSNESFQNTNDRARACSRDYKTRQSYRKSIISLQLFIVTNWILLNFTLIYQAIKKQRLIWFTTSHKQKYSHKHTTSIKPSNYYSYLQLFTPLSSIQKWQRCSFSNRLKSRGIFRIIFLTYALTFLRHWFMESWINLFSVNALPKSGEFRNNQTICGLSWAKSKWICWEGDHFWVVSCQLERGIKWKWEGEDGKCWGGKPKLSANCPFSVPDSQILFGRCFVRSIRFRPFPLSLLHFSLFLLLISAFFSPNRATPRIRLCLPFLYYFSSNLPLFASQSLIHFRVISVLGPLSVKFTRLPPFHHNCSIVSSRCCCTIVHSI